MQPVKIIVILCVCLFSAQSFFAQTFFYDKKNCGKYVVSIKVNGKNIDYQVPSIVLDLTQSKTIKVDFIIKEVEFGFDEKTCDKRKENTHNESYYVKLEEQQSSISPEGFQKMTYNSSEIGARNNKIGKNKIGIFTYKLRTEDINEPDNNTFSLVFNVFRADSKLGTFILEKDYTIVPSVKNEKSDETENITPVSEIDSVIAPKVSEEKDITIDSKLDNVISTKKDVFAEVKQVEQTLINEEADLWSKIKSEEANQNWHAVKNLSFEYRQKFAGFSNEERAWFFSIKYATKAKNKNVLCERYNEKFPNGELNTKIKSLCKLQEQSTEKTLKTPNDTEHDDWDNVAKKENTFKSYSAYLEKYGDKGLYSNEAKMKVEPFDLTESKRVDTDSTTLITYSITGNEQKEPLVKILAGKEYLLDSIRIGIRNTQLNIKKGGRVKLELEIVNSPWKKREIEIDVAVLPLSAEWNFDLNSKRVVLQNVKDGKRPYEIQLINADFGEIINTYNITKASSWSIKYDTIQNLKTGHYKFRLRDETQINSIFSEPFFIEKKASIASWMYIIPIGILGIFGMLIFLKLKNRTKSRDTERIVKKEIQLQENFALAEPIVNQGIRKQIKVHGKRDKTNKKSSVEETVFQKTIANALEFKLARLWDDTIISEVHVCNKCLNALHQFVFERRDEYRLENGELPEIGGFLLGKYIEDNGSYRVALEEFIDIESEKSGVYQISFGAKAWSKLEKKMEYYGSRNLQLIGWFHTHPGHGLFLSPPDLNIHTNFFQQPFQLAMEIDNVQSKRNPNYDVAFFTQRKEGGVNNFASLKGDWFQWATVKNWMENEEAT